jgi:four helix bundle protein
MDLVDLIYTLARELPSQERFGLRHQLQRAAVSICANIAEGAGRTTPADFARFLDMASGSASEVECLLEICHRRGFIAPRPVRRAQQKAAEVRRMLSGLLWRLRADC